MDFTVEVGERLPIAGKDPFQVGEYISEEGSPSIGCFQRTEMVVLPVGMLRQYGMAQSPRLFKDGGTPHDCHRQQYLVAGSITAYSCAGKILPVCLSADIGVGYSFLHRAVGR